MSGTFRAALALTAVLALSACTQQAPEISVQEQVPAAARTVAPEEAGDGEGGEPAEADFESTWVAVDIDFIEFDSEIPAGTVAIVLDNSGANLPHDVTIEELDNRTVVEGDGGEVVTGTVSLDAGTYTFYCSVPGHRATMEETVEVS